MSNLEQAARQALEKMEHMVAHGEWYAPEQAISALREALEQEPFEYWNAVEGWVKIDEVREHFDSVGCGTIYKTAGEGRVPLAIAQPKQKPVAWWNPRKDTVSCDPVHRHHPDCTPLYTEPPKREWVGLTQDETQVVLDSVHGKEWWDLLNAFEAKLKEKNT